MEYIIAEVENYDSKRNKVKLDAVEVTFLLYKGECRKYGIERGKLLSEEQYTELIEAVLVPRARKRVLYYLKNADRTREQIKRKLREGMYPEQVIDRVFEFLDRYGFADDEGYAERYADELKADRSAAEIRQKLLQRGVDRTVIDRTMEELTEEDELAACLACLRKRYRRGFPFGTAAAAADIIIPGAGADGSFDTASAGGTDTAGHLDPGRDKPAYRDERRKALAALARKGFSYGTAERAMRILEEEAPEGFENR